MQIEDVAEVVADYVREMNAPLVARIKELEARDGITSAIVDQEGCLVLTTSSGDTKSVGVVRGADGDPGKDGVHGLSADDVDATVLEDGRTVEFSLKQGEFKYAFELTFPVPIYRGTYKDGDAYQRGDFVTWAGSLWHCSKDTSAKPGTDDWQLAVKKGRDGKAAA